MGQWTGWQLLSLFSILANVLERAPEMGSSNVTDARITPESGRSL